MWWIRAGGTEHTVDFPRHRLKKWISQRADVAELADAHGSGPCSRKGVEVQVLSSAPMVDTVFFVIQYQAYSQARSTDVVAKGDYFKAMLGLSR